MEVNVLRAFITVVEAGSLNRAAEQLRIAQSTLSRQMQALESEMGGRLLERTPTGIFPTATGHVLLRELRPALAALDRALQSTRSQARGQSATLRIGYMGSATAWLTPALAEVRRHHPEVKVTLTDLTPGEQIRALAQGEIDVALPGQAGALLTRDFHTRHFHSAPVWVALADAHPLAAKKPITLAALREEAFIGANPADMPGYDSWVAQLCKRAGFKPRFLRQAESLAQTMALVVAESAVSLLPEFVKDIPCPGVRFQPLADAEARWELFAVWQRGLTSAPLHTLLNALSSGK